MRRVFVTAWALAAAAFLPSGAPVLAAGDAAKELAKLEERFESTELDWQKAYKAFAPEYRAFAAKYPGTDEALKAKLRLLRFSSVKEDEAAERQQAGALLDEILAEYPRSPLLGELPGRWYLFEESKFHEMMRKLEAPEQPDEVKAAVALHKVKGFARRREWDRAEPLFDLLCGRYRDVPAGYSTCGEIADALKSPHADSALAVGATAPEIVGKDVDGRPIKLSDFRGKVVVIDFFGDW